jgi:hypothetical protein
MDFSKKVPHADLVSYLRGNSTPDIDAAIKKLQKDDPSYKLLFDLISEIREQNSINFNRQSKRDTQTFEQLEALLENLFAGSANKREKQLFVDLLLSSASFYKRLMIKLYQISPEMVLEEIPEFAGEFIRLRSDEKLLRDTVFAKNDNKSRLSKLERNWIEGIIEIIRKIFENPIPRYAPIPIMLVLIISLYVNMTGIAYEKYWEKPAYAQHGGFRSSGPRSGAEFLATSEIIKQYDLLKVVFSRALSPYHNEQYAEVIQTFTLPKAQAAAQAMEAWLNTAVQQDLLLEKSQVVEMQRLAQEYYFYLGASYIGNYRKEKKTLFKKSDPQHLSEAVNMLAKAQTLANSYNLDSEDRGSYFLGLAYAIDDKPDLAQKELQKVSTKSAYFPKAQELIIEIQ